MPGSQGNGSPGKVGHQDGTVTLPHTLEEGWAHFLWANPPTCLTCWGQATAKPVRGLSRTREPHMAQQCPLRSW